MSEAAGHVDRAFVLIADANRLSAAAESFREEKHHLYFRTARADLVPRYLSDRVHATGDDVLSAAEALVGAYARAATVFDEFVRDPEQTMLSFPEGRRLDSAFKSVHIWLRAYQDAVCGVLLATLGFRVGSRTSMTDRLREGKPIYVYLERELPDYRAWFIGWRDRRDEMKMGAIFRTVIDGDPPRLKGVRFAYPRGSLAKADEEGFISLDDVIRGLEMSRRLTEVARREVERHA